MDRLHHHGIQMRDELAEIEAPAMVPQQAQQQQANGGGEPSLRERKAALREAGIRVICRGTSPGWPTIWRTIPGIAAVASHRRLPGPRARGRRSGGEAAGRLPGIPAGRRGPGPSHRLRVPGEDPCDRLRLLLRHDGRRGD